MLSIHSYHVNDAVDNIVNSAVYTAGNTVLIISLYIS